jgi:uncharacterized protein YbjT (DUF2867 family)
MFLVTGATGQVGQHVVRGLVEAGQPVRVLSRNPERARSLPGAEVYEADLTEPESVAPALDGVHGLYLFVAGNEPEILEQARKAGVRRVVLLSSRSVESHPGNAIALRHQRAENAAQDAEIPWTFLRPGQFASNVLQWAPEIRESGTVSAPFANVPLPTIHPADIAAVAVAALTGDGHAGQAYPMTGPEPITPVQQAETIGSVLGREITFTELKVSQARERMVRHMVPAIADAVLDTMGNATERDTKVLPTVEEITGRKPLTFEQWVRENKEAFSEHL